MLLLFRQEFVAMHTPLFDERTDMFTYMGQQKPTMHELYIRISIFALGTAQH